MCRVPAAGCATEYPDCSLLYSYPSEGWQVIGGNGADEEDTEHRCWRSCSAEEMLGLTASTRRAQTVWEGYWGASCRASSSTWLIWRSKQRSNLPESRKTKERNVQLWKSKNWVHYSSAWRISFKGESKWEAFRAPQNIILCDFVVA